jgi:hypothetical protein
MYLQYAGDAKANQDLFHSWEWLRDLCSGQPEQAWEALAWLVESAPDDHTLEVLGCGHLLDFLWQHPSFDDTLLSKAQLSSKFFKAASWCRFHPEEDGEVRTKHFESRLRESPFFSEPAP